MIVNFNFNLEAWVKQLMIEADSVEAAKERLMSLTLQEMFDEENISVDSDMKITDIDATVFERTVVVNVTDIEYDFDHEDLEPSVAAYLANRLPKERTLTIMGVREDEDIEELIDSEIYGITGYATKSFEFQVIEEK